MSLVAALRPGKCLAVAATPVLEGLERYPELLLPFEVLSDARMGRRGPLSGAFAALPSRTESLA